MPRQRLVVYVPDDTKDWVIKSAANSKRSPSEFASLILQSAHEEDSTEVTGNLADHLIGITPQPIPLLRALRGARHVAGDVFDGEKFVPYNQFHRED